MITTVDFLRHGETEGGSYYRGSTDDPLSNLGWQQMQSAVADQKWDLIISSPLHRCLDFSQQFSAESDAPLLIEADWQEIDFGDWEGKKAEQINADELMRFYQDPVNNTPNNGENYKAFLNRVNLAWECLLNNHAGKNILVVTHAGVIRSLFTNLLDLPSQKVFNIQADHARFSRFQCFHDESDNFVSLVSHNQVRNKNLSIKTDSC